MPTKTAVKKWNKYSEKLRQEIESSILLPDKEKEYWLGQIPSMPEVLVKMVYKMIWKKNKIANRYIETALADKSTMNPMIELEEQVKKIKARAFEMDEVSMRGKNDDILKELSDV